MAVGKTDNVGLFVRGPLSTEFSGSKNVTVWDFDENMETIDALLTPATATASGLVPTPPNDPTKFLSGDGTFRTPSGGGGAGFTQVKLAFHDTDILNMQVDGSGGLVLLPQVTNKIYIVLFCVAHFHYGGVAAFGGTALGDIILGGGFGGGSFSGSTGQLLESTSDFWENLLPINISNNGQFFNTPGQPVTFATQDTNLTGGDPGGNTNTLTITLGYLTYDCITGDVS